MYMYIHAYIRIYMHSLGRLQVLRLPTVAVGSGVWSFHAGGSCSSWDICADSLSRMVTVGAVNYCQYDGAIPYHVYQTYLNMRLVVISAEGGQVALLGCLCAETSHMCMKP